MRARPNRISKVVYFPTGQVRIVWRKAYFLVMAFLFIWFLKYIHTITNYNEALEQNNCYELQLADREGKPVGFTTAIEKIELGTTRI